MNLTQQQLGLTKNAILQAQQAFQTLNNSVTISCRQMGKTARLLSGQGTREDFDIPHPCGDQASYPDWMLDFLFESRLMDTFFVNRFANLWDNKWNYPSPYFDRRKKVSYGYKQEIPKQRAYDAQDLCNAIIDGHTSNVHGLLRSCKVSPNERITDDLTPSFAVSFCRNEDEIPAIVKLLVQYKADFGVKMNKGQTPLHFACDRGNNVAALSLLPHVSTQAIDAVCAGGFTPLNFALRNCSLEVVAKMIYRGAKLDHVNLKGETLVHEAVASHYACPGRVLLLLCAGADANVADVRGLTPLHHAVMHLSVKIDLVEALANTADMNKQVSSGHPTMCGTALHLCARIGQNLDVVKKLIELGCDPFALDPNGKNAREVCPESTWSTGVHSYLEALELEKTLLPSQTASAVACPRRRL